MKKIVGSRLAWSLPLLMLALACSSPHKRAEKLMEAGNYEEAVRVYEGILTRRPKDEKAQIQLKQARAGVLDQRLIAARKARQGGNPDQALDILLDTVNLSERWKMPPMGKAAFTQEEEIGLTVPYGIQKAQVEIQAERPARAAWFARRYEPVLRLDPKKRLPDLKKRIQASGAASCRKLASQATSARPHFAGFVATYCSFFGQEVPGLQARSAELKKRYFARIQLDSRGMQELSAPRAAVIQNALQEGLTKTGWFQPGGRALAYAPTGFFRRDRSTKAVPQTHVYKEMEPYTVVEKVTKTREIPFVVEEVVRDPATGLERRTSVTRTRVESYVEDVPVTRQREVERVHRFTGVEQRQDLELVLSGQVELDGKPIPLQLRERKEEEGIEHHEDRPNMGLSPSKVTLTDPEKWVQETSRKLAAGFESQLVRAWVERHCSGISGSGGIADSGEQVMRCTRQPLGGSFAAMPDFVNQWYENHLGITVAQAQELFGKH